MRLKSLLLQGFRSYKVKRFSFAEGTTLVAGRNGSGKTNLVEAVWMLATGKSFRAGRDTEMIKDGQEMARLSSRVNDDELEIVMAPRKRYLVNGAAKRRMDFVGRLRVVLFRPEDLELILGSPAVRRDYLDVVLEQVDREYRRSLLAYKKGVRQRNRLLLKIREGEAKRTQLLFWDKLLIKNGEVIQTKREEFIEFANAAFAREKISQVFGGLVIVYDKRVISEGRLKKYAVNEVAAGVTLVGPHRDDFKIVTKNKRDLSVYGSRGEQRLAVLVLKLAELSFVTVKAGERPLLLLDDIFSELDHMHREDVLAVVGQQQAIITTIDLHLVDKKYLKNMKVVELS